MAAIERAYTVLTERSIKSEDNFVIVSGIASTPKADRMRDIVEPMGAQFKTPMPLLLHHDHQAPVGHMTFAKPSAKGIPFEAKIPRVTQPGRVKDRVDEAIHSLEYGLISAVSIGFQPVAGEMEQLKDGGIRFLKWLWLELSLVTIPANADAVIQAVKSLDQKHAREYRPHLGVKLVSPGVSGTQPATTRGAVQLITRK